MGREKLGRGQVYRVHCAKMFGVGFKVSKWERRSILTGERGSVRVNPPQLCPQQHGAGLCPPLTPGILLLQAAFPDS